MDIIYSILDFKWVKEDNSFYASSDKLWPSNENYFCSFPNGRKKFYIKNYKTGGFRKFILYKDFENSLEFISEDGILCNIQTKTK